MASGLRARSLWLEACLFFRSRSGKILSGFGQDIKMLIDSRFTLLTRTGIGATVWLARLQKVGILATWFPGNFL